MDCRLYQERNFTSRSKDPFPIQLRTLDAVLRTYAQFDELLHLGLLEVLTKSAFSGMAFCYLAVFVIRNWGEARGRH